ncbi:WAS/WASL-interacting protein family member 1-like [Dipodomys merriami]|uniref:WAS/WASL-interacting protein family member 1-like n=1 Tax=Dipodomys merriami TaxID=94247 RepID=UPI003855DD57
MEGGEGAGLGSGNRGGGGRSTVRGLGRGSGGRRAPAKGCAGWEEGTRGGDPEVTKLEKSPWAGAGSGGRTECGDFQARTDTFGTSARPERPFRCRGAAPPRAAPRRPVGAHALPLHGPRYTRPGASSPQAAAPQFTPSPRSAAVSRPCSPRRPAGPVRQAGAWPPQLRCVRAIPRTRLQGPQSHSLAGTRRPFSAVTTHRPPLVTAGSCAPPQPRPSVPRPRSEHLCVDWLRRVPTHPIIGSASADDEGAGPRAAAIPVTRLPASRILVAEPSSPLPDEIEGSPPPPPRGRKERNVPCFRGRAGS